MGVRQERQETLFSSSPKSVLNNNSHSLYPLFVKYTRETREILSLLKAFLKIKGFKRCQNSPCCSLQTKSEIVLYVICYLRCFSETCQSRERQSERKICYFRISDNTPCICCPLWPLLVPVQPPRQILLEHRAVFISLCWVPFIHNWLKNWENKWFKVFKFTKVSCCNAT